MREAILLLPSLLDRHRRHWGLSKPLQWHHNEHPGVSNHRRLDCLFNCLFRLTSKKTSKPVLLAFCEGNPPVTGGFPSQRASNAETVSIWWCEDFTKILIHYTLQSYICCAICTTIGHWLWFCSRFYIRYIAIWYKTAHSTIMITI